MLNQQTPLLSATPFFDAYLHSDLLGRLIFLALIALSIITWVLLLYKGWMTYDVKRRAHLFQKRVEGHRGNFLKIAATPEESGCHFLELYQVLKKQSIDLLSKNRRFGRESLEESEEEERAVYLSPSDIGIVEAHLSTTIALQTQFLEKNLYILSTVVTLAPFLGLLGTVWGILISFGEMQSASGGSSNQMVLAGLSLALATTVLGLFDAIPALIGYNYLKNVIREHQTEMECFSSRLLASLEMHYRKVDVI